MASLGIIGIRLVVQDLAGFNAAMGGIRRQITFLGGASANLATQTGTGTTALNNFTAAISAPSRAITALGANIRSVGKNIRGLGNEIAAIGFRMSFLLSLPVLSAAAAVTKAANTFETEMTKIVTLVGLTEEEVSALGETILDVAPSLGALPTELAEAAFFVTSGGIRDTAAALKVLDASAKASAIGLGEVKDVANAVTSVVLAYGSENITAARATDVLTASVRQGKFEAQELAPALGRVLGLAASQGVVFEEVGAFIAAFTRSGVSASEATSALVRVLTTFAKPTTQVRQAMAALADTTDEYAAVAEFRAMLASEGLARTLVAMARGAEAAGIDLSLLFGRVRGLNAVLFNAGQISEEYLGILRDIEGSAGIVEQGFARVQETTQFQLDALKASLQVAAITIGSIFLPAINRMVQVILPAIEAVRRFADMNKRIVLLGAAFAVAAALAAPLLIAFGLLVSSIGTLIGTVGGFISLLGVLLNPLGSVTFAVIALAGVLSGLLLFSLDDVAKKTSEISGLVASDFAHMNREGDHHMRDLASRALQWGRNIVISLANGIAQGVTAVVRVLIQVGNVISGWLQAASPPRLLPRLPEWGAAAMTSYMEGWLSADFSTFNDISNLIERFFTALPDTIMPEIDVIPNLLGSRTVIAAAIQEIQRFGTVSQDMLNAITGQFGPISQDIQEYILLLQELHDANNIVFLNQIALDAANQGLASAQMEAASASSALEAAQADLAATQEHVNEVFQEFEEVLTPLRDELSALEEEEQAIRDQGKREDLMAILEDPRATPEAIRLAELELAQMDVRDQISAAEAAQDAAVTQAEAQVTAAEAAVAAAETQLEVAQAQVAAAQEQVDIATQQVEAAQAVADGIQEQIDAQLGLINAQIDNLELMRRQEQLLQGNESSTRALKDAVDELSESLPHLAGGIEQMLPDEKDFEKLGSLGEIVGEGVSAIVDQFEEDILKLIEDIKAPFEELTKEGGLLDQLKDTWSNVFIELARLSGPVGEALDGMDINLENIVSWLIQAAAAIIVMKAVTGTASFLFTLAKGFRAVAAAIGGVLLGGEIGAGLSVAGGGLLGLIATFGAPFFIALGAAIGLMVLLVTHFGGVSEAIDAVITTLGNLLEQTRTIAALVGDRIREMKEAISGEIGQAAEEVELTWQELGREMVGENDRMTDEVERGWTDLARELVGKSIIPDDIVDPIVSEFEGLKEDGLQIFSGLFEGLVGVTGWVTRTAEEATELIDSITETVDGLLSSAQSLLNWLRSHVFTFNFHIPDAVEDFLDSSPSPFRQSLMNLEDFLATTSIGQNLGRALAPVTVSAPAQVAPGAGNRVEVNMGGQNINNGMDMAVFEAAVIRAVGKGIRGV